MAKEQVENAEIPDKDDAIEQVDDAPKDVRGAIRAAMDEVNGEEDDRGGRISPRDKSDEDDLSPDDDKTPKEDEPKKPKQAKEEKEPIEKSISPKEGEKEEVKIDPPPFYKVKGKATWDKLSPEDKKTLVDRETEISNGFKQYSSRIKGVEDLERAIAPRLQEIQKYGVSPGVVVDRLFQWMEGLNNPSTKANTFKELAKNFGVNINQLSPNSPVEIGSEPEVVDTNTPPEWFSQFSQSVTQELGSLKQNFSSQQEQAAANVVNNWARDKPYYTHVSQLMGQLISSGVVPLKDGNVDLDGAYDAAIKLHPEVSAQIQQEASQKAETEAAEKAAKEAKDRADKLARSRKAGASLKPSAPSMASAPRLNGKAPPKGVTSVRDSIRSAIEEVRDN